MRLCFSLLLFGCLVLLPSCVMPLGGCTAMGCGDGLTVLLEPALVEEGVYEIVVEGGDRRFQCTVTIPPPEKVLACPSENGSPSSQLYVDYSKEGEILGFGLGAAPGAVTIAIQRDGVGLVSETLRPKYDKYQPNGEACDGDFHCKNGTVVLRVP